MAFAHKVTMYSRSSQLVDALGAAYPHKSDRLTLIDIQPLPAIYLPLETLHHVCDQIILKARTARIMMYNGLPYYKQQNAVLF